METTYQQDISGVEPVLVQLQQLFDKALKKVTEKQLSAHTVTIKIKYHDFVQITRSRTLPGTITGTVNIKSLIDQLLINTDVGHRNVRLLGVTLSSFDGDKAELPQVEQIDLFECSQL